MQKVKMISWIVIVILVIIGIFAIRLNHLRHRIFIIILVLLALFIYISMTVVAEKNQMDFKTADGIFKVMKLYVGWLANGFQNLRSLIGHAIKMDWQETNKTFTEKTNPTF